MSTSHPPRRARSSVQSADMAVWPLLDRMPGDEVGALVRAGHPRDYAPGQHLVHAGEQATAVHLVLTGHVALHAVSARGDTAIMSVLGPGSVVGEPGHAPEQSSTTSVSAIEAVQAVWIRRVDLDRLRHTLPGIDGYLLREQGRQLEQLSEHLMEMLFMTTPMRVTRRLLVLAEQFGGVIPLTQHDIARMCGTTRPTVNETVRRYERLGAVRIARRRIEVLLPDLLQDHLAHHAGLSR